MAGTLSLLKDVKIDTIGALIASANNTDLMSTTIVDMAGYDGCLFIAEIAVTVNTAVCTINVLGNALNSAVGMVALTGATATVTDAGGAQWNNTLLIIDVFRPLLRYLELERVTSVAVATYGPAIAIRYKGKRLPITQTATVVGSSTTVVGV
jgi:hypothetical protein